MTDGLVASGPVREDWRWFDAAPLDAIAASPRGAAPDAARWWLDLPGPRLLFVDGVYRAEASAPGPVAVSHARYSTPLNPYGERASAEAGAGYVLALKAGGAGDPVQIVHLTSGGVAHLSNRIVLERDAQASIIETHAGRGWSNATNVFELGDGARLMRALRVLKDDGAHTDNVLGSVGEAGSLATVALVGGCRTARLHNDLALAGAGAFVESSGAVLTRGEESVDVFNDVHHAMPDGASRQVWRAVAADRSTASMAARVRVRRDAQKTDGEQSLRAMLLHRTATVNLKPELEIFADDVKCAHGATVGELDARALFYLESRGIPPARAKALLTRAFVADAIDRIGDETVRAAFAADADAWLEAAL